MNLFQITAYNSISWRAIDNAHIFKKVNPDDTLKQELILGKTTVTNINIFFITHIPGSFTDVEYEQRKSVKGQFFQVYYHLKTKVL